MGRINVTPLSPSHEVFVGYDSPMETFFGQVYDILENPFYGLPQDGPDDPIVYWVGLTVGEIKTVDELREKMEPYCVFSDEVVRALEVDYNNRTTPTPLQRWGREQF